MKGPRGTEGRDANDVLGGAGPATPATTDAAPASLYDARPDLYDLQHDEFDEDLALFVELAEQAGGPILELGCGTGRVLEALRRRRVRTSITGLDRSAAMLQAARKRLGTLVRGTTTLVEGDLRHFSVAGQFGLIIAALNTFMELLTPEDQLACLLSCATHVRPGGLVILDILNPYDALSESYRGQLIQQFTRSRPDGSIVALASSSLVDATAQYIETYRQYDEWGPQSPVTRSTYTLTTRFTHRYEIEHLVARAGLVLKEAWGDYEGSPWEEDAPRLLILAARSPE